MTNQKHTPGPWHWHYDGFNQISIYSDTQTKCGSKAVVNHLSFYAGGEEEQKANACLIAAAPDLLEACELALEFVDPKNPNILRLVDKLHAAIAKAKGE